ncbi:MAG: hypothetical protein ACI4II_01245 [Acutalibacteraceae bacterium]
MKRITLIMGHYGSGKTNIAVNMALDMRKKGLNTCIADLDIVNPYFRAKDSLKDFEEAGIRFICSDYANSNLDIPALPPDLYAITDDKSLYAVLDIGGDDRGALVLGRLVPSILAEDNYDMLMVINKYRPLTRDAESALEVMREMEYACGMRFTGIINNSNLGAETTADDVLDSLKYAEEISRLTNLPIAYTTVEARLYDELNGKISNIMPLNLQERPV